MVRREVHTRGVVLARRAAGEGSVRVLVYTEDLGLITALATSAREERSKLRPHTVVGAVGTFSFVLGKEYWRLTGAVGTSNIFYSVTSTQKQEVVSRVYAFVRQFVRGEGVDTGVYDALHEFHAALPSCAEDDARIIEYVTVLRILASLGYVAQTDDFDDILSAPYTAALMVRAKQKNADLVRYINDGIAHSGL